MNDNQLHISDVIIGSPDFYNLDPIMQGRLAEASNDDNLLYDTLMSQSTHNNVSMSILKTIKDESLLINIATSHANYITRRHAIDYINDENALYEIYKSAPDQSDNDDVSWGIRLAATEKIHEPEYLKDIIEFEDNHHVRRAAHVNLSIK